MKLLMYPSTTWHNLLASCSASIETVAEGWPILGLELQHGRNPHHFWFISRVLLVFRLVVFVQRVEEAFEQIVWVLDLE